MELLDELPCAVLITDGNGQVLFANTELLRLTGRTLPSCLGASMDTLLPSASRIFLQTHVWPSVLRDGSVSEVYLPINGPQGQRVPVLVNGRQGQFNAAQSWFWTFFVARQRQEFEAALLDTRRHTEEALRLQSQSERFTRSIADSIPGLVAYWDKDLICRFANQASQRWFGKSPDALLGSHLHDLLGPQFYADNEAPLKAALAGQAQTFERTIIQPDGVLSHTLVNYVPDILNGQVAGFLVVVSDITSLKHAEEALRAEMAEREQTHAQLRERSMALQQAQRLGHIGSWTWQRQGEVLAWSDEMFRIFGRDPGQGAPRFAELARWYLPESFAQWQDAVARTLGEGDSFTLELEYLRPDGTTGWVESRGECIRNAQQAVVGLQGTTQDITLRRHQDAVLATYQALLDRTERLAGVGGWELIVATGAISWSAETKRMHGVAPDYQPTLATAIEFYAEPARLVIQAAVERALSHGEPWHLELPLVRADGRAIWARAVGATEFIHGKPARIFGAFQDITERRQMDERLTVQARELKRSNEDLERFAYVASHDLQEPLRMVTSYGQLLTRRHLSDLKPEAQEFVAYMVDGGQRAQALIRDLLSLARLDSQAQPWAPVSLETTLADALRPLRLRLQETGAQVHHDALPTVTGDARQLGQLMANLLGNALKFCGQAAPLVHVGAVRDDNGWRISVRDNGIGIEPRFFNRIFQMFQRLHLRTEYDGTGIGLAICKKVVERHGGCIGVESTPGQGATFFFTLPDHPPGAPHRAAAPQAR